MLFGFLTGVLIVLLMYVVHRLNSWYIHRRFYAAFEVDGTQIQLKKDLDTRRTYWFGGETIFGVSGRAEGNQPRRSEVTGQLFPAGMIGTIDLENGKECILFDGIPVAMSFKEYIHDRPLNDVIQVINVPSKKRVKHDA